MFEENILANTFSSEGFVLFFSILCFLFSSPSNQSVSLQAKGSSVTRNSFSMKKEEFHDHFKQFLIKTIERLRFHVYGKRQTWICTTWPSFPLTSRLLFIISSQILVVSRQFYPKELFWIVFICSVSILRISQLQSGVYRLPYPSL